MQVVRSLGASGFLRFVKPNGEVTAPLPASERENYLAKGYRVYKGENIPHSHATSDEERCVAITSRGTRCVLKSLANSPYCHQHHATAPAADEPPSEAQEAPPEADEPPAPPVEDAEPPSRWGWLTPRKAE